MLPAYTKSEIPQEFCLSRINYDNKIFYSYSDIIDLRNHYLDFINTEDKEKTKFYEILNSVSCNTILACTINVESIDYSLISDFDITELVKSFAFPGNRLYLSEPYILPMLYLISKKYASFPDININSYLLKKIDSDNLLELYMNLNLKINYCIITSDAEKYEGNNIEFIFDKDGKLNVNQFLNQ